MRDFHLKPEANSVWTKLAVVLAVVFFLYLGDAVISDWLPSYMQGALGGSLAMGVMMSFASVMGLLADLIFPQLFKNVNFRKMTVLAISSVFITAGILLWTTHVTWPAIFLLAMGTWGVYYEFLYFGVSQFVAQAAPVAARSGVWSIIGVFKSVAYSLGPILGSWIAIWKGDLGIIFVYLLCALIAYLIWTSVGIKHKAVKNENNEMLEKFNMAEEIKYWSVLFKHTWQILLASLTLGIIDAAFWTTGVVLSEKLTRESWLGGLLVPVYVMPSIFVGFMVARLGITKGKKKLSEIFMLLTGIFMIALGSSHSVYLLVLFALMVGIATSITWPLLNAVYSDVAHRMGREQKHMSGISSSTGNLSYIVGPIVTGFLASRIGEIDTLKYVGVYVFLVSLFLLIVTPKKIRMPQSEIATWN